MSAEEIVHCQHCGEELRFVDGDWIDCETHDTCDRPEGLPDQKHEPAGDTGRPKTEPHRFDDLQTILRGEDEDAAGDTGRATPASRPQEPLTRLRDKFIGYRDAAMPAPGKHQKIEVATIRKTLNVVVSEIENELAAVRAPSWEGREFSLEEQEAAIECTASVHAHGYEIGFRMGREEALRGLTTSPKQEQTNGSKEESRATVEDHFGRAVEWSGARTGGVDGEWVDGVRDSRPAQQRVQHRPESPADGVVAPLPAPPGSGDGPPQQIVDELLRRMRSGEPGAEQDR